MRLFGQSKRVLGGAAALAIAGAAISLSLSTSDVSNAQSAAEKKSESVHVGTYQPQKAFENYHGAEQMNRKMQELQTQMQQAQQQGDRQRMQQIQQQMQQLQNDTIEQFYNDVESAAPEVARQNGVSIVAVEILFTEDQIDDPKDLTDPIIKKINADASDG